MKKFFCVFLIVLLLCPSVIAEENAETVVQMTYSCEMPDVTREGQYTGEIANGIPHGYGVFTATNSEGTNWHYLGEWVDGKMEGQGGCYWDFGYTNVGEFDNNAMVDGYVSPILELSGKELSDWSTEELMWLGSLIDMEIDLRNDKPVSSVESIESVDSSNMSYDDVPAHSEAPTATPTKEPTEIILKYPELGQYGVYYTFNANVEKAEETDKETIIQCFVPAGNYTLTNEGKYPTFVFIYSKETVISDMGWEEPADTWVSKMLQVGDSCEISIPEDYYINLQENDVFKLVQ